MNRLSAAEMTALRKAATASFIGNFIEWFDYASYAYLATTISVVFFPNENKNLALLQTFAVFALSFLIRPIGGMIWGTWGDKYGRRWALSWSILFMSGATFMIGILPGYARIGVLAPIMLLLCRLVQGFSASGEYAGAATFLGEYAPEHKRGMYTSLVPASTATGLLIGSLMVAAMNYWLTPGAMEAWAWRVPFLLALPLGMIGRYIRVHLEDSEVYRQMQERIKNLEEQTPVRDLFKFHWREVCIGFGVSCLNAVGFYMLLTYTPTYLKEVLNFDDTQSFLASTITLFVYVFLIFAMGYYSDHIGRRRALITACIGFIVFTVPLFWWLDGASFVTVVLIEVGLCVLLTLNDGTLATFLVELFPSNVRYTGFALSFNAANALFGGTAPFIATWLIGATGSKLAPAIYLIVIAVVALGAMIASKDRTGRNLEADIDPEVLQESSQRS
ncbi:MAG: MFS transporter [Actinomycetaceae bacterium]|nr:MFS transporter [Actinomycetaceae bacterium]